MHTCLSTALVAGCWMFLCSEFLHLHDMHVRLGATVYATECKSATLRNYLLRARSNSSAISAVSCPKRTAPTSFIALSAIAAASSKALPLV